MTKTTTNRAVAGAALVLTVTLTGCTTGTDNSGSAEAEVSAVESTPASMPAGAQRLLARYGLGEMNVTGVIDHLDRLGAEERPTDLMASVRPNKLLLSAGEQELSLDLPDDRFYLSVAPYVEKTHECFYHSLTTCQGELAATNVRVEVLAGADGEPLVDETRTTFANGFVGLWLPRGIEGTLRISYDGKVGETRFATDGEAPTCLTNLMLS